MTDKLTPAERSVNMSRIKSGGMLPELRVRQLAHALGYRFRLHGAHKGARLPGKPDLVFARLKKVIFVHGCFWHQHRAQSCKIVRRPKSNGTYWDAKLARNVERDRQNLKQLKALGWRALVVWECETKDVEKLRIRLQPFLSE